MSELAKKQQRITNTDEVANLDVLRAVAVSSVFLAHLSDILRGGYSVTTWRFGQLGVLMFFVHTSLVLMFSLERQQLSSSGTLFIPFYIRRWFRLYPLSIFFVLFTYVASGLSNEPGRRRWTETELFANLSLTQNVLREENMIGVLWTLPLEVQMYVFLPFLFHFLLHKSWLWAVWVWCASLPLVTISLFGTDRLNIFEYVPCFLGGVLAWKISRRYAPILPSWLWPVGIAAASLVWFVAVNMHLYDLPLRWIFCAILGTITPMFHTMGSSVVTKSAAIIAKYSYGIYLSHTLVMAIAFHSLADESHLLQWGVFVLLALALPYLAFHLIEAPMINIGKRLTRSTRAGNRRVE